MTEPRKARMTKGERDELTKIVNGRAKFAKLDVDQRAAEVTADFEEQMATRYEMENAAWSAVTAEADKQVKAADAAVAAACREMGVPDKFRPELRISWYSRGENASKERRGELRKVAMTRIADQAKSAKLVIERAALDLRTKIATDALESTEAQFFLESMPSAAALMPTLMLGELESSAVAAQRAERTS